MADVSTVEQRLDVLERQVARLQAISHAARGSHDWLAHVRGSFKNDPIFGEIIRLGRQIRQADRPEGDAD